MENCLKANPEQGHPLNETKIIFSNQKFVFNHDFQPTPFIQTELSLYELEADENLPRFGYFILDVDLDGNHLDAWLVHTD
ncbi:MAG: hypothetical protein HRT71_07350 [Flavobacteriales bacterium]|nr:hypothetical protein [Flavobacteriales bacterium]